MACRLHQQCGTASREEPSRRRRTCVRSRSFKISLRASPRDSSIPDPQKPDPHSGLPLVLCPTEPAAIADVPLPEGSTCGCSSGCGQPKHSRRKCFRTVTVLGGQLCSDCICSWLGCTSPRRWGKHCIFHKRKLKSLSTTWQVVIAAGPLNCELVPVDAITFCEFWARHRTSF